ncbi:Hydrogenase-4 transcriptional activator [Fibrisoma limi BUZ 3]|uniref:Hydrogenase-4 transcriptional activator n=1 Tax=Fibrisoma limi BUZ 3 TaxID=1185876 RepID=I2GK35_9BACT|nr:sigma 54-interacting response regulator [Fibrisoma limi]CCH54260.1 Hydrogenase-4 transcriptional activator [Fibrisoma limi BUZ 3]
MDKKILIVEDEFIIAKDLRLLLERNGYTVCGIAKSVTEAMDILRDQTPDLVLLDIQLKGNLTGIDLAHQLQEKAIAFVYLSSNTNQSVLEAAKSTHPYGFIVKPFREKDVLISLDIAHYRYEQNRAVDRRQRQLLQHALDQLVTEPIGSDQKLLKTGQALLPYVPFDCLTVGLEQPLGAVSVNRSFLRIGYDEYQTAGLSELAAITGVKEGALTAMQATTLVPETPVRFVNDDFKRICQQQPLRKLLATTFRLQSNITLPLHLSAETTLVLALYSRSPDAYKAEQLAFLSCLQPALIEVIQSVVAEKNNAFGEQNRLDTQQMSASAGTTPLKEIIGNSPSMVSIFDQLTQVAPYETSVLILGESGTGKERIARAIHQQSPRHAKPLVVVNCGALPANLIESELFGHEKGAFTGAVNRRIGKFEMASEGTLFLDEIGEMPLDLQVKLLRVLQEKQIERVGGKDPIKIDVRILAATNRNLEKEIAEGRFRLDLYYRLNVFPIVLPPLRERCDDIKPLANHFARQFCQQYNKPFLGISDAMMTELERWIWPGNIRELENCIEQSVILHNALTPLELKRPLVSGPFVNGGAISAHQSPKTLLDVKTIQEQTEKDYLLSILKGTRGRIRGHGGAAEVLNLKPTTLESRMAKLGIKKEDIFD